MAIHNPMRLSFAARADFELALSGPDGRPRSAAIPFRRSRSTPAQIARTALGLPTTSTADAEWVKHNLSRIHDSLPNGYCGRPPQQDCPHPNACLTCPDFQTTPEFLDVHRQHATTNRKLIARADANGQFRLAANLRRVQDSLDQIIPALEALDTSEVDS
jgi:hypothetical protein